MRSILLFSMLLFTGLMSQAQTEASPREIMNEVESARPSGLILKQAFGPNGDPDFAAEVLGGNREFKFTFSQTNETLFLRVASDLAPYSKHTLEVMSTAVGSSDKMAVQSDDVQVMFGSAATEKSSKLARSFFAKSMSVFTSSIFLT